MINNYKKKRGKKNTRLKSICTEHFVQRLNERCPKGYLDKINIYNMLSNANRKGISFTMLSQRDRDYFLRYVKICPIPWKKYIIYKSFVFVKDTHKHRFITVMYVPKLRSLWARYKHLVAHKENKRERKLTK